MSQFDVYRLSNGTLLVDLQSDFVENGTRTMAPLMRVDGREPPFERLEPIVSLDGEDHYVQLSEIVAVVASRLPREVEHDLREDRDRILTALNFLFWGF